MLKISKKNLSIKSNRGSMCPVIPPLSILSFHKPLNFNLTQIGHTCGQDYHNRRSRLRCLSIYALRTCFGGRRSIRSPSINDGSGLPKNWSASAVANPAICVASIQALILSAFLICRFVATGNFAGNPKRRCIAPSQPLVQIPITGPHRGFDR